MHLALSNVGLYYPYVSCIFIVVFLYRECALPFFSYLFFVSIREFEKSSWKFLLKFFYSIFFCFFFLVLFFGKTRRYIIEWNFKRTKPKKVYWFFFFRSVFVLFYIRIIYCIGYIIVFDFFWISRVCTRGFIYRLKNYGIVLENHESNLHWWE